MITYVEGDATQPQGTGNKIIAYVCNTDAEWSEDFALALSQRWPDLQTDLVLWAAEPESFFDLGGVEYVHVEDDIWVALMLAQHGYGETSVLRCDALEECLSKVGAKADFLHATVHIPRTGILAASDWDEAEQAIRRSLVMYGTEVVIYSQEQQ